MGSSGYWEIRTYECGALGEKTKYWVPGEPPARGRKLGRSSERKQRQNENDAARRLNREIHANFSAGDLFLGLDYGPKKYSELLRRAEARQEADRAAGQEPGILEDYLRKEANRELDNFIRRVKRRLPPGAELKYIAVTSDMDGETGEAVRIHHHIIANRAAWQACVEAWPHGCAYAKALSAQKDYTPLAEYLLNQVRRLPDEKKYKPSRNLVRPQPKCRVVWSGAELRVPKGCELLYRTAYSGKRAGQYIRYALPFAPMRS